jgi:hypothetical protein
MPEDSEQLQKPAESTIPTAPVLPGGLTNRFKWAYWRIYRWARPLNDTEIQANIQSWRKDFGIPEQGPEPPLSPLSIQANRCCVMTIPGVGTRCSTEPSNDTECRALARKFNPDAIGHFYPTPCQDCQLIN